MITSVIVDTGATVSCISFGFSQQLSLKLDDSEIKILTANGNTVGVGRAGVIITLGNITEHCNLYVIKDLQFSLILGLDLIPKFRLTIHKNTIIQGVELDLSKDYKMLDSSIELQGDVISTILVRKGDKPCSLNISVHEPLPGPTLVDEQLSSQEGLPSRQQDETTLLPADAEPRGSQALSLISAEQLSSDFQVICITDAVKEEISKICNPELVSLLNKYISIFSTTKFDIGRIGIEKCRFKLNSENLVNKRPYPASRSDQERIQQQIDELLSHGLIRLSTSPYSSPVTLVDKKDDGPKTRLVVDYREINKITVPDNYPFLE